jgi:hypothetical protein
MPACSSLSASEYVRLFAKHKRRERRRRRAEPSLQNAAKGVLLAIPAVADVLLFILIIFFLYAWVGSVRWGTIGRSTHP